MTRKVFITSFPYVYERYFKMFDHFKDKDKLFFILPNNWQAKRKGRYIPVPARDNIHIVTTRAYFWHSHYPLIGGLLKCLMPGIGRILKRNAHPGDILFTATEPNLLSVLYNAILARRYGLKHIIYTDQNVPYRQRLTGLKLRFVEWIVRTNLAMAERVICSNRKALEILLGYTSDANKFVLIPQTGVDTSLFRPGGAGTWRSKYHLHDKTVFAFAGMLEARKGIMEVMSAFFDAHKQMSNIALVFVGFGPEKSRAEAYASAHNLGNAVIFIDFVPNEELPHLFDSIDVFVCYSLPFQGWEEQLGYSMRESLASGIPVISTRTGSIDEIVVDGTNGILVEPHDHHALVMAMVKLASDGRLRSEMGHAARTYAMEHFSYEVIASRLETFFDSL